MGGREGVGRNYKGENSINHLGLYWAPRKKLCNILLLDKNFLSPMPA